MKWILFVILATSALAGKPKSPPQSAAETIHQIMQLRLQVTDFYANPNTDIVRTIRDNWEDMPVEVRQRIEGRHSGTSLRIFMLDSEIPQPVTETKDAPPTPGTATNTVTITTQDIWKASSTTENKDQWASVAPPPKPREINTTPLLYSDDLDIFGNRPKPRFKR